MMRLRFKNFMRERCEFSEHGDETLLSVSEYYGVKAREDVVESDEYLSRSSSLEGYRKVHAGDLVMNYMLAWKGAYGISDIDGIVSPAYAVFSVDGDIADRRYIHHRLRSAQARADFRSGSKGIIESRLRLYPDAFLAMSIDLPDRHEQTRIADFLDQETALIDRLIQTKEKLSASLAAKRSASTIDALSGVQRMEWDASKQAFAFRFRENSWSTLRAKHAVEFMTSGSRGWSDFISSDGDLFLQSGNIGKEMDLALFGASRISRQEGAEAERTLVRAGDVLVCITGGRTGSVGYVNEMNERAHVNQHVCLLRASTRTIMPKLLAYLFWSEFGQAQMAAMQYGMKQGLGFSEVGDVKVPVPPRDQQPEIVHRIDRSLKSIDDVRSHLVSSIGKLLELRASLITSAVNAQIDLDAWRRRGQTERCIDQLKAKAMA